MLGLQGCGTRVAWAKGGAGEIEERSQFAYLRYESRVSVYFIGGVSGAGKSSIIPHLKSLLPADEYAIYDFDERGVPDSVDERWRQSESEHWLQVAIRNAEQGISTIVCGLSQPDEILECESAANAPPILFCLLDLSDEKVRERLSKRYETAENVLALRKVSRVTPEEFITSNISYAKLLRELFGEYQSLIIDTSQDSESQTVHKIAQWIMKMQECPDGLPEK